ncbi:hypothetical protein [Streptomyces sp. NBC_00987]|uniref:hypothetical protein n=1 Tax=Streptomyces sp. NBC_00987 TaxID=2903703 RepID=UPI00386E4D41|nr:hypothetical protein OG355_33465 [Streptomyces sp. NBC_00987]
MSTATPTQSTALMSPADVAAHEAASYTRQAQHALKMLATVTPGRRRVIEAAATEYLSQIDRRRLPLGWNQPITDDRYNRVDAYRMRRGHVLARMLGISCRPSDPQLPDTARAVLAAIDAAPRRLTDLARTTGQPALVALLHMVGTVPALSSVDAAEQQRDW